MNETSCYKINGRIFFKHKDVPCKRRVMKTLGVKKNTFAGNMISRVYDYYFQGAINLKKEYRKYYRKEFCSVEKFIEEHFNIELDDAKKLAEGNYSMKECSRCSVERNIETLNYDESFKKAFSKAVGELGFIKDGMLEKQGRELCRSIIYALDGGLRYHNYEIPDYESIKKVFGEKSARLFVKNKGYHAYWGYTSSDDSPITQFFTTDSFEIEDKDFYLNGRACVW